MRSSKTGDGRQRGPPQRPQCVFCFLPSQSVLKELFVVRWSRGEQHLEVNHLPMRQLHLACRALEGYDSHGRVEGVPVGGSGGGAVSPPGKILKIWPKSGTFYSYMNRILGHILRLKMQFFQHHKCNYPLEHVLKRHDFNIRYSTINKKYGKPVKSTKITDNES